MKCLTLIFVLFISGFSTVFSQNSNRVETVLELYPDSFNSPEELANFIRRDFKTEEEKVRAVYSWIIQNVAYNPDEYKKFDYRFKNYRERNEKEEKTRKKIISRTLKTGVAVCEGYSFLFEKLCNLLEVRNYLVRGDTKSNFSDIGRAFATNHLWNIAYINGKPYLFDPTWGAGKFSIKFIKDTSYFYYKTPPEQLIKTHYPSMFEDALVDFKLTKEDFSLLPLIINKKVLIEDIIAPKNGILFTDDYLGAFPFEIQNIKPEKVSYSYDAGPKKEVDLKRVGNTLTFSIPIELGTKNLLIYFNNKPALGYVIQ